MHNVRRRPNDGIGHILDSSACPSRLPSWKSIWRRVHSRTNDAWSWFIRKVIQKGIKCLSVRTRRDNASRCVVHTTAHQKGSRRSRTAWSSGAHDTRLEQQVSAQFRQIVWAVVLWVGRHTCCRYVCNSTNGTTRCRRSQANDKVKRWWSVCRPNISERLNLRRGWQNCPMLPL